MHEICFAYLDTTAVFRKGIKNSNRGERTKFQLRERERRERDRREKQLKLLGPKFEDKELFRDTGGALE